MKMLKVFILTWAQSLNQILSTTPPFVINKNQNRKRKVKKNLDKHE